MVTGPLLCALGAVGLLEFDVLDVSEQATNNNEDANIIAVSDISNNFLFFCMIFSPLKKIFYKFPCFSQNI
jgi:hypothetical protein